jgi:hypothetical protein
MSISAFLLERSVDTSLIDEVVNGSLPQGVGASKVSALAMRYRGLNSTEVLEATSGECFTIANELLSMTRSQKLDIKTMQRNLEIIASLLKEARSAASSLHSLEIQQTRQEIGLSVAARFVEVCDRIFAGEDSQFRNALQLGLKAAMLEIEKEL